MRCSTIAECSRALAGIVRVSVFGNAETAKPSALELGGELAGPPHVERDLPERVPGGERPDGSAISSTAWSPW
jgi:hypothetical protein